MPKRKFVPDAATMPPEKKALTDEIKRKRIEFFKLQSKLNTLNKKEQNVQVFNQQQKKNNKHHQMGMQQNQQQWHPHPNQEQWHPHPNQEQWHPHPNQEQWHPHPNQQQWHPHPNQQQWHPTQQKKQQGNQKQQKKQQGNQNQQKKQQGNQNQTDAMWIKRREDTIYHPDQLFRKVKELMDEIRKTSSKAEKELPRMVPGVKCELCNIILYDSEEFQAHWTSPTHLELFHLSKTRDDAVIEQLRANSKYMTDRENFKIKQKNSKAPSQYCYQCLLNYNISEKTKSHKESLHHQLVLDFQYRPCKICLPKLIMDVFHRNSVHHIWCQKKATIHRLLQTLGDPFNSDKNLPVSCERELMLQETIYDLKEKYIENEINRPSIDDDPTRSLDLSCIHMQINNYCLPCYGELPKMKKVYQLSDILYPELHCFSHEHYTMTQTFLKRNKGKLSSAWASQKRRWAATSIGASADETKEVTDKVIDNDQTDYKSTAEVLKEDKDNESTAEVLKEDDDDESTSDVLKENDDDESTAEVLKEDDDNESTAEMLKEDDNDESTAEVLKEDDDDESTAEVLKEDDDNESTAEVLKEDDDDESTAEVLKEDDDDESTAEVLKEDDDVESTAEVLKEDSDDESTAEVLKEDDDDDSTAEVHKEDDVGSTQSQESEQLPKEVALIGDSWIQNFPIDLLPDKWNVSKFGWKEASAKAFLVKEDVEPVIESNPSVAVIHLGANDICKKYSGGSICCDILNIVTSLEEENITTFVCEIPSKTAPKKISEKDYETVRSAVNADLLQKLSKSTHIVNIPNLKDHLHNGVDLSAEGYVAFANILTESIESKFSADTTEI